MCVIINPLERANWKVTGVGLYVPGPDVCILGLLFI